MPHDRRTARFITVAAIASPSGEVQVAEGQLQGVITEEPAGAQGFVLLMTMFFVPELGKTLAELSPDEKNRISHRAKAFTQVREILGGHIVHVE